MPTYHIDIDYDGAFPDGTPRLSFAFTRPDGSGLDEHDGMLLSQILDMRGVRAMSVFGENDEGEVSSDYIEFEEEPPPNPEELRGRPIEYLDAIVVSMDGIEVIVAGESPMITDSRADTNVVLRHAQEMASQSGLTFEVIRFTTREHVATISPFGGTRAN